VRTGDPIVLIREFVDGGSAVFANHRYDAHGSYVDAKIQEILARDGSALNRFHGSLLHAPEDVLNKSGDPFQVFTPFKNAVFALPKREVNNAPKSAFASHEDPGCIESFALLPSIPWDQGLVKAWPNPTEHGAHERLTAFLSDAVASYKEGRDFPARAMTSRLSPYLRFGQISPIRIWHVVEQFAREQGRASEGARHFLSEVCWREFSYHLLARNPHIATIPLKAQFAHFPWKSDAVRLTAWTKGRTGVPIVDAGMRELWHTGYMHNRVRMIVASYLVKNLGIPWQDGEEWFWDTLVDADPANNAASWQWVAGCGMDAAPFFRVFNPVLQAAKFDPDATYIKTWVPELARLDAPNIFAPWEAGPIELEAAGVRLGETYPRPLVDLKESREWALSAFEKIKGK
jgi:deoxyribodipyrimidine photo-lyase